MFRILGRSAVTAADDQRVPRRRMRDRGDMDEILVIEELVLLGSHEMAVQPEQAAELRRIVDFDDLVARLKCSKRRVDRMK